MKILVTGANGFIGSHVARVCVEGGHELRALVQPGTPTEAIDDLDAELIPGDVTDPNSLSAAARGVDAVIHLAAIAQDWGPPVLFERVNVGGTHNMLDAARRGGVRRFVLVSSVAVHAYRDYADADETTPRDGHALPYGRSKIVAEDLVMAAHAAGELEGVIVRPGVVPFGPNDRNAFVPLARAIATGRLPVVDGGGARFTTAYAENLADGLLVASTHPDAAGGTVLMADDEPVSWRTFFAAIATALGVRPPRLSVPSRLLAPAAALVEDAFARHASWGAPPLTRYRLRLLRHDLIFRSTRARRQLDWRPRVGFEEGIRRTVAWYRGL